MVCIDKFKEQVVAFYNNKEVFFKVIFQSVFAFFLYLGFFVTFMKGPGLINNGKVSLSLFPGSNFFEFMVFISIFIYAALMIIDKQKIARIVLLIQVILGTLFHFYGVLIFRVGSEGNASGGFGRIWTLFFIVILWVMYVKPDLVTSLLQKVIPNLFNEDTPQKEEVTEE